MSYYHSGARASSESHESLTSEDRVRISTSAVLTVKSASLKFRSSSSVWSTRPPGEGGGPAKSGVVGDSSPSPSLLFLSAYQGLPDEAAWIYVACAAC